MKNTPHRLDVHIGQLTSALAIFFAPFRRAMVCLRCCRDVSHTPPWAKAFHPYGLPVTFSGLLLLSAPILAQSPGDTALNDRIDRSIDRGLAYLAATQKANGTYDRGYGDTAAIAALAGMAFLSKGYLPGEGQYGENINRAIDHVLSCADNNGYFGKNNGQMYAHCIATLFLSETSGMVDATRQKRLDTALAKAVKIILDAQQNMRKSQQHQGGWRYQPTSSDSDMSCSGWALMALRSCRLNGGGVPPRAINDAVEYVKRHSNKDTGSFGYQDANAYGPTLTGAGILCLELCGQHNDPISLRAASFLMKNFRELSNSGRCFYGLYYTSQGLFQLGGESWQVFSSWMYDTFIKAQKSDGSWDKGEEGSPAYQTAMCILAFTVPYRQLPIYQRDETVDEK
jgi:hypothetical protein